MIPGKDVDLTHQENQEANIKAAISLFIEQNFLLIIVPSNYILKNEKVDNLSKIIILILIIFLIRNINQNMITILKMLMLTRIIIILKLIIS
jgi:hypothetical protein